MYTMHKCYLPSRRALRRARPKKRCCNGYRAQGALSTITAGPTFLAYRIPTFGAIPDLLLKGYRGHMHFEAIGEKKTRLIWIGYFDCAGLQRLSEPLTRILLRKMITTMANNMKTYLEHK